MSEFKNIGYGPIPAMLPVGHLRDMKLLDSLYVYWQGGNLTVPVDFVHDGPSIPNRLRGLVYYTHKLLKPSIVHDYLYVIQPPGWPRKRVDTMFLAGLEAEGVAWLRRSAMWTAVRAGGGNFR